MASSQDTEITLGTAKLLGLFFGLVGICAVFFALGYTLGRKSDSGLAAATTLAPLRAAKGVKPGGSGATASTPMTFYKAVEQQNANPQLSSAAAATATTDASRQPTAASSTSSAGSSSSGESVPTSNPPDPMAPVPASGYFVQVAAVSKQDDADSLVDALKTKLYPAFVASNSTVDKLFRVQVGPFGDIKEAETMRSRLISDGYNPILKK
ncbi:MAG TPA: SPOR domain-containing protein [Candidatus Acidoferrales bacterium]|nr:SPOR domain-containing protein [Candidatus Acidoferrales bacterium]